MSTKPLPETLEAFLESTDIFLYGDLDPDSLLYRFHTVFKAKYHEVFISSEDIPSSSETAALYWTLLSIMDRLGYFDYGTSPRGGWLTDSGKNLYMDLCKYLGEEL